nr:hypothetical protein [Campylobacterota bacterium]
KFYTKKHIQYYDTSLISLILSTITIPFLWFISEGNLTWVIPSVILWAVGVFTIFHPFIRNIFPLMITKQGTFLLASILALFSIWFNITIMTALLPFDDVEMIFNNSLFSISLESMALFVWFYILIAGTLLINLELRLSSLAHQHKKLMQKVTNSPLFNQNLLKHYSELLLVFILPVALLFWTEITYSTRVLLGAFSIVAGFMIFIHRLHIHNGLQKILVSTVSLITVLVVNSIVINLFGIEKIPATSVKARISKSQILHDFEAQSMSNPSFQLSSNQQNSHTSIYKIVTSVPQLGLHLGYRVATIPNESIEIKTTDEHYTIHDQYNNTLVTLDK